MPNVMANAQMERNADTMGQMKSMACHVSSGYFPTEQRQRSIGSKQSEKYQEPEDVITSFYRLP